MALRSVIPRITPASFGPRRLGAHGVLPTPPPTMPSVLSSTSSASCASPLAWLPHNCMSTAAMPHPKPGRKRTVTLIRGDGIGPETTSAVTQAFAAMKAPIDFESYPMLAPDEQPQVKGIHRFSPELLDSITRNGFVLKGPLFTPTSSGFDSPDLSLARAFDLYAHVVPVRNVPSIKTRHDNVDLVVIRENTQGEYSGLEHEVNPGVVQSLKVITREASRKIAEYAFQYAIRKGRKKVTAVHKANIMKMADGLFLECCREVAGLYRNKIDFDEVIIDNCCMQLVSRPEQFDVLVMGNLYGCIVSQSAAGLAGGIGLIPGINVGPTVKVYEQGCRHLGMNIAGKGIGNPIASLRAGAMMLDDMGLDNYARVLRNAVRKTVAEKNPKVLTPDIPGCNGTTEAFTQAVIDNMEDA